MINNKVFYVQKDDYNNRLNSKQNFICKIEIGKTAEDNMQLVKKIIRGVGSNWYQDREDKSDNYNAIEDYLSDISYALDKKYQAIELYIDNTELIDKKFIELLIEAIKEHEFNVAEYSGGSQRMISFDIYIKFG